MGKEPERIVTEIVIVRLNLDFSHGDKENGAHYSTLVKGKVVNNFGGCF